MAFPSSFHLWDFLHSTSMHGLKYAADKDASLAERYRLINLLFIQLDSYSIPVITLKYKNILLDLKKTNLILDFSGLDFHCRLLYGGLLHPKDVDQVAELTGSYLDRIDRFSQLPLTVPGRFYLQRKSRLWRNHPENAPNFVRRKCIYVFIKKQLYTYIHSNERDFIRLNLKMIFLMLYQPQLEEFRASRCGRCIDKQDEPSRSQHSRWIGKDQTDREWNQYKKSDFCQWASIYGCCMYIKK